MLDVTLANKLFCPTYELMGSILLDGHSNQWIILLIDIFSYRCVVTILEVSLANLYFNFSIYLVFNKFFIWLNLDICSNVSIMLV